MHTLNHSTQFRLRPVWLKFLLAAPVVLFMCLTVVAPHSHAEETNVLVISNSSSQMESISVTNLRSIFAMRSRHWSKGVSVEVFVLPDDHPTHVSFAKVVLRTFPYNLRRLWDRRVYSGTGQLPHLVQSEEEMLERVRTTPNAVGYITQKYYDNSAQVVELKR